VLFRSAEIMTEVKFDDGSVYVGELTMGSVFHGKGMMKWNSGADEGNSYDGDWVHNRMQGHGTYRWRDGSMYEGDWANGVCEGKGRHTCPDGSSYDGDWRAGKMHGQGKRKWGSNSGGMAGCEYEGQWDSGVVHGTGTFVWPNGNEYVGQWDHGKRHGQGKMVFRASGPLQGDEYSGTWAQDKITGTGNYSWANGDVFEGAFVDGLKHGQGKLVCGSKSAHPHAKYEGSFASNVFTGYGIFIFGPSDSYEGQWEAGQHSGHGIRFWPNGHQYSGMWKNGNPNGHGTYVWEEGTVYDGDWEDGLPNGQGRKIWGTRECEGNMFVGDWVKGTMHGKGVYTWRDGSRYEGEWDSNQCSGQGVMRWVATGDEYEGHWHKDLMHGKGKYIDHRSGDVYEGEYINGLRQGPATHHYLSPARTVEEEWKQGMLVRVISSNVDVSSIPLVSLSVSSSAPVAPLPTTAELLTTSTQSSAPSHDLELTPSQVMALATSVTTSSAPAIIRPPPASAAGETDPEGPIAMVAGAPKREEDLHRALPFKASGRPTSLNNIHNLVLANVGEKQKKKHFSTVVDTSTLRSKGFIMITEGMSLADVRKKITLQLGSILQHFIFINLAKGFEVPHDDEDKINVVPDYVPNCNIKIID